MIRLCCRAMQRLQRAAGVRSTVPLGSAVLAGVVTGSERHVLAVVERCSLLRSDCSFNSDERAN